MLVVSTWYEMGVDCVFPSSVTSVTSATSSTCNYALSSIDKSKRHLNSLVIWLWGMVEVKYPFSVFKDCLKYCQSQEIHHKDKHIQKQAIVLAHIQSSISHRQNLPKGGGVVTCIRRYVMLSLLGSKH